MSLLEQLLLGLALAMDCFSVSIAAGLMLGRYTTRPVVLMALFFGLFQALMPLFGWLLTISFGPYVEVAGHWIAFVLLLFIGGKMIYDHFHEEEGERTFDPNKFTVIITLAVATSIDALAVGVSLMCMGLTTLASILQPILIIGITSTLMSFAGSIIGIYLGRRFCFPAELLGGIILICIGIASLVGN